MSDEPVFLEGDLVILRPLEEADFEGNYAKWLNDKEVCEGNSHHTYPYTKADGLKYIRHALETRSECILAVVDKETKTHIGNIALQSINPIYRTAEFAIIIGERDFWGKGYAKDASKLIVAHGFNALNLERIACGTFDGNVGMEKLAAYLGMKEEGRRRGAVYKDGKRLDMLEFGVLREEFFAAHPQS